MFSTTPRTLRSAAACGVLALAGTAAMLAVGYSSDRTQERRWHLLGACVMAALGLPVAFLTPPNWKRLVGIPAGKEGAKDAARAKAIARWPAHANLFARVKDDGRAEAALIGLAGIMKEKR